MNFDGDELRPGDVVISWSQGERRRAIVGARWTDTKAVFQRIIRRFPSGQRQWADMQRDLSSLGHEGQSITVREGGHELGLVKPYELSAPTGPVPVLICQRFRLAGGELGLPIVVGSVEEARDFVSRHKGRLPLANWVRYDAETLPPDADQFFRYAQGGPALRTRLEEDLDGFFARLAPHQRRPKPNSRPPVGRSEGGRLPMRRSPR